MSRCNAIKRLGQNRRCYKAKSESPRFPDATDKRGVTEVNVRLLVIQYLMPNSDSEARGFRDKVLRISYATGSDSLACQLTTEHILLFFRKIFYLLI